MLEAARVSGLAVRVWTVEEPRRLRELADMGVDAVITNAVDVAVNVLRPGG